MKQTPKEKAEELVRSFIPHAHADFHEKNGYNDKQCYDNAKHCAIVLVDDILDNFGTLTEGKQLVLLRCVIRFYEEVRNQIQLL